LPHGKRWTAIGLLAVSPAVIMNTLSGQNGCLSGALLMGGVLLLDRRPIIAGILFGLLTFKPHLGIVLAFALVALGAWRTIASAAATTAILVGLSVALFGTDIWGVYLTATRAFQLQLLVDWQGFYVIMMPTWFAPLRSAGLSYGTCMMIQAMITPLVLVAVCWAVRRTSDPAVRAFVIAAAIPLALPYGYNYDLPALAVACIWVVTQRIEIGRSWHIVVMLGWLAPLLCMSLGLMAPVAAPAALTALFVLAVALTYENWSGRGDSNSRPSAPKADALPG
jgi:hypothetical protein